MPLHSNNTNTTPATSTTNSSLATNGNPPLSLHPGDPSAMSATGTDTPPTERYVLWERSYTRSVFPLLSPASPQDPSKDPVLEGYRLYLVLQW